MTRHRFCGRVAILLCLAVATTPAAAAVLDQGDAGFTVENSVVVPVDAQTAWSALVNEVGRWWPSSHTWTGKASNLSIDARAGGCFCERGDGIEAQHMAIGYVQPGVLLRMTGGLGPLQGMGFHGALEWRFAKVEGGTRITLWYRAGGYSPKPLGDFVKVVDQVQGLQLGGLAEFLRRPAPAR